ncbi:hypothetical protein [Mycobacterium sp. URHB0021]
MLKLNDSLACIELAKKQSQELNAVFGRWAKSQGIEAICVRDRQYARYTWAIAMYREPEQNLTSLAGELVNNLRIALDYVALQIYQAGGGDPAARQAESVSFPIVDDEKDWEKAVSDHVPFAWDEAKQKLQWCQPFVQIGPQTSALPALRGVGARDKHHNLVLYAMAVFGVGDVAPDLGDDIETTIKMAQPGPDLSLDRPAIISEAYLQTADSVPPNVVLIPWSSGIKFDPPPAPGTEFGFRATDGSNVSINAIPVLISYVEQLVKRFEQLEPPPPMS